MRNTLLPLALPDTFRPGISDASRMKVGDLALVRVGDDAQLATISRPLELADDRQRLRRAVG